MRHQVPFHDWANCLCWQRAPCLSDVRVLVVHSRAGVVVLLDGNGVAKLIASCDLHTERRSCTSKEGFERKVRPSPGVTDERKTLKCRKPPKAMS